ncbi:Peptide transporter PTR5 [Apostasia shenzhenica]|uniref:Peptide transporter PTR5 n=1 Tax=Apostasia shenzhenica TaxID=1088818 RepID=A0A2I0BB23_9ASPA|nr:Peptide transporter PTR5 [Apostasia shenzhenica]
MKSNESINKSSINPHHPFPASPRSIDRRYSRRRSRRRPTVAVRLNAAAAPSFLQNDGNGSALGDGDIENADPAYPSSPGQPHASSLHDPSLINTGVIAGSGLLFTFVTISLSSCFRGFADLAFRKTLWLLMTQSCGRRISVPIAEMWRRNWIVGGNYEEVDQNGLGFVADIRFPSKEGGIWISFSFSPHSFGGFVDRWENAWIWLVNRHVYQKIRSPVVDGVCVVVPVRCTLHASRHALVPVLRVEIRTAAALHCAAAYLDDRRFHRDSGLFFPIPNPNRHPAPSLLTRYPAPSRLVAIGGDHAIWSATPHLYASLLLAALGAGGIRPCVVAFGTEQFPEKERKKTWSFFNWYYFALISILLLAVGVHVYTG